jgi:hypothetical protein
MRFVKAATFFTRRVAWGRQETPVVRPGRVVQESTAAATTADSLRKSKGFHK